MMLKKVQSGKQLAMSQVSCCPKYYQGFRLNRIAFVFHFFFSTAWPPNSLLTAAITLFPKRNLLVSSCLILVAASNAGVYAFNAFFVFFSSLIVMLPIFGLILLKSGLLRAVFVRSRSQLLITLAGCQT